MTIRAFANQSSMLVSNMATRKFSLRIFHQYFLSRSVYRHEFPSLVRSIGAAARAYCNSRSRINCRLNERPPGLGLLTANHFTSYPRSQQTGQAYVKFRPSDLRGHDVARLVPDVGFASIILAVNLSPPKTGVPGIYLISSSAA
jgi:hypothetical protein